MVKVGVIALGLGNVASVVRMLDWLEISAEMTCNPKNLSNFSHLILPGVGHFSVGTKLLTEEWRTAIHYQAKAGKPLLGICLGMQLLCSGSEEGEGIGLEFFPLQFRRIPNLPSIRVPHMGWNELNVLPNSNLLDNSKGYRFYYVHSFYADGENAYCTGSSNYGVKIAGLIEHENVYGTQFHPEKSHRFGMELLSRFCLS